MLSLDTIAYNLRLTTTTLPRVIYKTSTKIRFESAKETHNHVSARENSHNNT